MIIYIYLKQIDIGQIICDQLSSLNNLCFLFSNSDDLFDTLENQKKMPDLLILDYLLFNHDLFNVYIDLKEKDLNFPVIFYNDPCITKSTRLKHWLSVIELTDIFYKKKEDYSIYTKPLEALQDLVESKELSPYISLLQPPQPLPNYLKKEKMTLKHIKDCNNDYIFEFRDKVKLPNNLFYLLKIFQQNKSYPLTIEDIQKYYTKDEKKISEKSLKVLISNLKHKIKDDDDCKFIISQNNKLYTFLRIESK